MDLLFPNGQLLAISVVSTSPALPLSTLFPNGQIMAVAAIGGAGGGAVTFSAGTQSASLNSIVFSNANGVSFGLDGSTITATVAAAGGGLTNIRVSAGTTSNLLSAITFSNANNVSFGLNASTITASVTVASTQGSINLSAGTTSNLASAFTFSNANNVSFGLNASTITATVTVASTQGSINLSAGTTSNLASAFTFSNANNVSFGLNASTITATVTVASTQGSINLSAGTTSNLASAFTFSNANNISFGLNASTITATVSQSSQSAIKAFGATNTGNTAGNTGVSTGIDWVLAGSNNITISESTVGGGPNTLWVSGPTVGGAQTGISGIVVSDTTYTSGTVSFSNAGNITISSSVNGATQFIRLSGNAAQTTQSAIKAFGASNTGNTLGDTGVSTGIDWVVAGTDNITISESTVGGGPNTLWISGAGAAGGAGSNTLGMSNLGNTSGTTGVVSGSAIRYLFAGGDNVTLSQSLNGVSGTLTISAGARNSFYARAAAEMKDDQAIALSQASLFFYPMQLQEAMSVSRANFALSVSHSSSAETRTLQITLSIIMGMYTRSGDTLSSVSSGSKSYGFTISSNDSSSSLSGRRIASAPFNVNASPGDYWFALLMSSSSSRQAAGGLSVAFSNRAFLAGAVIHQSFMSATNASGTIMAPGYGIYTASSTTLPSAISITQITMGNNLFPMFALMNEYP